eukprot:11819537-Heterocapsa_arctica.AAC.1
MATERVVHNPGGRPAAAAAAPGGSVKARRHEQRARVREERLHEVARRHWGVDARRVHRLRDEVLRQ